MFPFVQFKTDQERQEWAQAQPAIRLVVVILSVVRALFVGQNTVVTAVIDEEGGHKPNGMHPKGRAMDLRVHELTATQKSWWLQAAQLLVAPLGGQALLEVAGTPNEHLHVSV